MFFSVTQINYLADLYIQCPTSPILFSSYLEEFNHHNNIEAGKTFKQPFLVQANQSPAGIWKNV